jgi:HK97 gp10 family phage protein
MATFNVKITGVDAIIRKINNAPKKVAEESTKIINDSVKEISNAAKARVPVRTSLLKNSIGYSLYSEGVGASVFADTKYAAYVEFGTGSSYGIPPYKNINKSKLEAYALTFKVRKKELIGRPYKPYMFNSYSEVLSKMVNKIKKIRI